MVREALCPFVFYTQGRVFEPALLLPVNAGTSLRAGQTRSRQVIHQMAFVG
jgi:hypothetical protein